METMRIVLKVAAALFFAYYGIMLMVANEKKNIHDELFYGIWLIIFATLWH